jgi:hypothetical protein
MSLNQPLVALAIVLVHVTRDTNPATRINDVTITALYCKDSSHIFLVPQRG